MSLDDLLHQPLAPVRDDGFSAALVLRLERARQRRVALLWVIMIAAVLPLSFALPWQQMGNLLLNGIDLATGSLLFQTIMGLTVLFWAWQARLLRF